MKKKKLNSLGLKKQKISQLHNKNGGAVAPTLDGCLTEACAIISVVVCAPPATRFCTVQCVTRNCTFIGC